MKGESHPVQDLIQEVRIVFLNRGFDEVENQLFIPEEEVYKQYGPEAPVVLDRCYYLAGLPRPDIGLSAMKVEEIKAVDDAIDINGLKEIFREYRGGSIEGDDLLEEMVTRLGLGINDAVKIIDFFPAFREIKAESSKLTLRSHMTAAWYPTLESVQGRYPLPVKLFSTGLRFRREQRIDATHLRAHYGASCVIMDEGMGIDEGMKLSEGILHDLGFSNIRFVKKAATSNYYEIGTEYELFSNGIEIADCGVYSGRSLSNYNLKYPVFNLGFGLERVLMVRGEGVDVREILYPQFYSRLEFSDEGIAEGVIIAKKPETDFGKELVKRIVDVAAEHADADSPCEFLLWEGELFNRKINVSIVEREDNAKLLGPAALNEIYVYAGGIYGIPQDVKRLDNTLSRVVEEGVSTGVTYLEAVANLFAYYIEKTDKGFMQVKMVKGPSDVNIEVNNAVRRYITSRKKRIYIKGPVFMSIEVKEG